MGTKRISAAIAVPEKGNSSHTAQTGNLYLRQSLRTQTYFQNGFLVHFEVKGNSFIIDWCPLVSMIYHHKML